MSINASALFLLELYLLCFSTNPLCAIDSKSVSGLERESRESGNRIKRDVTTTLTQQVLSVDSSVPIDGIELEPADGDIVTSDLYSVSACNWLLLPIDSNSMFKIWRYEKPINEIPYLGFGFVVNWANNPIIGINNNVQKHDLPTALTINQWYHVCFTWRETDGLLKYYQDGQKVAYSENNGISNGGDVIPIPKGGKVTVGNGANEVQISELDIWNRVLDDEEVFLLNYCATNLVGDLFSWGSTVVNVKNGMLDLLEDVTEICVNSADSYNSLPTVVVGCSLYYISTREVSYQNAEESCLENGGDDAQMAVIPDEETNNAIVDTIYENYLDEDVEKGFWIGLAATGNKEETSSYTWADGRTLADTGYSNWARNEPNDKNRKRRGHQECVQLWKRKDFKWDDDWCYKPKGSVCQRIVC